MGLGSDGVGRAVDPPEAEGRRELDQRGERHHRDAHQRQPGAVRARGHPGGEHGPRAVGEETDDAACAAAALLLRLHGQRLPDEGMPGIVNRDRP